MKNILIIQGGGRPNGNTSMLRLASSYAVNAHFAGLAAYSIFYQRSL